MTRFSMALALLCQFVVTAARAAEMQYPMSVAAGPDGSIYVADKDAHSVWKIADGKLEAYFQGSNKFRTPLNAVWCVAVDSKGRVLAGDSATREVYRFNAERQPEPLTNGGIGIPWAMAFDGKGDILVCDLEIHQVVKFPEAGGEPVKVAEVAAPRGIAVDAQDRIWVVDAGGKDQVLRVLPDGTVEKVVEGRPFQMPHNIALDKDQNAYVCDNYGETQTLWVRGEVAWQRKEFDVAEKILKEAIHLDPEYAPTYNILGNMYFQLGRYEEAATAFEHEILLHPNGVTYYNLLLSIAELSDTERLLTVANTALKIIEKELQKNPDSTHLQLMLAHIYNWAGQAENALREADALDERNDLNGFVLFNLGGLYNYLGNPVKFLAIIRRAITGGFRAIEAVKNCSFPNPEHTAELQEIVAMLEELIENERHPDKKPSNS